MRKFLCLRLKQAFLLNRHVPNVVKDFDLCQHFGNARAVCRSEIKKGKVRSKKKRVARKVDSRFRGDPAHDRFDATLACVRSADFEKCFLEWMTLLQEIPDGQLIAIDGKTLRRSYDKPTSKSSIHMVSALATATPISRGQEVVEDKRNEAQ